jgi:hypothetical protein
MKWDIDKALRDLAVSGVLLEKSVTMVLIHKEDWAKYGLRPNVDQTTNELMVWCLAIGRYHAPKLAAYALTIREAYLKMRRAIKELDEKWADIYGVRRKPKRKKFDRFKARKPVEKKSHS